MNRIGFLLIVTLTVLALFVSLSPLPAQAQAPAISNIQAVGITANSAVITWATNELATSQVEYGTTTGYGSTSPQDTTADQTSHAVVLSGLSSYTTYHFRVKSTDADANEAVSDDNSFTTLAFNISGISAQGITSTSATIVWITDVAATAQVEYGPTTSYGFATPLDGNLVASHIVVLSNFSPETTYHYRVKSTDYNNREVVSADNTFTTLEEMPPVISNITTTTTQTTVVISWTTDQTSTSQVEYGLDTNYGSLYPSTVDYTDSAQRVMQHIVAIVGLAPNTTYHYRVKSIDAYGKSSVSEDKTFQTQADTTPPVISNVSAPTISDTQALITWKTNEPATSRVEYGTTTGYGSTSPLDTTADKTSHTVMLTGLTPGTTYHYRVVSTDGSGNTATSSDYTFNTISDVTPPQITVVTASNMTTHSAVISWNTNELATSQVEYGLDINYGSTTTIDPTLVTNHSLILGGLDPATTYHYRVRSKDAVGNEQVSSDNTFTTLSDTTTPTVTIGNISDSVSSLAQISGTASDASTEELDKVQVSIKNTTDNTYWNGSSWVSSEVWRDAVGAASWSYSMPTLTSGKAYQVQAKAIDKAGHESSVASDSFTFDTTAPVISAVTVSGITASDATISWTTNEPATSKVEYSSATSAGLEFDSFLVTTHSVALSELEAGTTYQFKVTSQDAAGNPTVSADYFFTTLAPGTSAATLVVSTFTNETPTVVDASAEAGVTVSFSGTGSVTGTVEVVKYTTEPTTPTIGFSTATGKVAALFVDVQVNGFALGTATITVHYTDAEIAGLEEAGLLLYYWDGDSWEQASGISVDTASNTVTGSIPVSALSGTPVAIGGSQIPPTPASSMALIGGIIGGAVVVAVVAVVILVKRGILKLPSSLTRLFKR